jgi:nucleoid-associated protein YgaU
VGLLLTAASTVPGAAGRLAGWLLGHVLPGSARRAAALALGLGLGTVAPVALLPVEHPLAASAAAAEDVGASDGQVPVDRPTAPARDVVPDWPTAPADPLGAPPDWPHAVPGEHVVVRGECLWDIAAEWLERRSPGATAAEVAGASREWWQANAAVIGPDPDLLLPGQVLRPPG